MGNKLMKNYRRRKLEKRDRRDGGDDEKEREVEEEMVMWQNKGREEEQRKKGRDQGRGSPDSLCLYLCCRLKQTRGSSVEACSSFCLPPQGG